MSGHAGNISFRGRGGKGRGGYQNSQQQQQQQQGGQRGGRGGHSFQPKRGGGSAGGFEVEPCKFFVKGECRFGNSCAHPHNIQRIHEAPISQSHIRGIALYVQRSLLIYSDGNKVKFLNTSFSQVEEISLPGNVETIAIDDNFLFIAYSAIVPNVTAVPVSHIRAYNLASQPPTMYDLVSPGLPSAHALEIHALETVHVGDNVPPVLFSGSADTTIRMWQLNASKNQWDSRKFEGHSRGVTSLAWIKAVGRLYSGSIDKTIKSWDPSTGNCTSTILPPANAPGVGVSGFAAVVAAKQGAIPSPVGIQSTVGGGHGHSSELLGLTEIFFEGRPFLISGSLDGSIKAWDLTNPDSLVPIIQIPPSEKGSPLVSMSSLEFESAPGNPVVLVGHHDGSIVIRDVRSNLSIVSMLNGHRSIGHVADVKALFPGPNDLFFSGGNDGRFFIWQCFTDVATTDQPK
jgi:WD40 repeat protein